MKMITSEVKNLLDKLYNLRGEDSVILKQMNKEREDAIETQERTKNEKEILLKEIERLTNEEAILADQGNHLISVLSNINRDEFAFVLDALKIDFEPAALNEKVNKLLPETIDKVVSENKTAKEKLENVETEMNNAITKVEELGIRKDEALSNQNKLNEYFDLALNGNINITRDEIVTLLEKFDFTEDEKREAAKILMFPEDALYEYDNRLKGIVPEEKAEEKEIEEIKIEKAPEAPQVEVPKIEISEIDESAVDIIEDPSIMDMIAPQMETNEEEDSTDTGSAKDILEKVMTEAGLNINSFSSKALTKILENYEEDLLKKNVAILNNKHIKLDVVIDNYELLYDKELEEKVNKLLEIGKDTEDIALMPSVLVKYDLNGLKNTINVLQISGLDPKKVPLMAY